MTRRTIACVALVSGALSVALLADEHHTPDRPLVSDAAASNGQRLAVLDGDPIERPLAHGEEHRFQVALAAGEWVRIVVEQRGVDVAVRLRGRDNELIADVDEEARPHGEEQVDLVADEAGVYTIAIRPAFPMAVQGTYVVHVADRRAGTDADRSMQACRRLRATAAALEIDGNFEEARAQLQRALDLVESVHGREDRRSAAVALQLAGVYRSLPDNARAESLYLRAIETLERTAGANDPLTAHGRTQLAVLYQHTGERRKAERLVNQALGAIDASLGPEHPWFAAALATLSTVRDGSGDLEDEEQLLRRAQAILEKIEDTESMQYVAVLNNLGEVYRQREAYGRAKELYARALTLAERLLGPDNYALATSLQDLAIIAREGKDYPTAIAYNMRALSIRERALGPDHPTVAQILTNLGNIYRAIGDTRLALESQYRALRIWEQAAGAYQPATLVAVGNIARTYAAAGDLPNALASQSRADAILEKELAFNLASGSERQKLAFVRNIAERTDRTISLHLRQMPGDSGAAALAALVLLQRKGRVQDAMMDTFATVRQRMASASDRGLLDELNATTVTLARAALTAPPAGQATSRHTTVKDLEKRKEQLEADLADHSAEFRAQLRPITLEAVQAAIPADAALLEFAVFRPFDATAERNAEAYGAPHYTAYVIRREGAPRGFDLGPAAAINDAVDALREALRDPKRTDLKDRARAVDRLVVEPLRASFGDAARLLISPDSELNLVPFEALVDRDGCFLIEHYDTSYLTSGRDLVRMQVTRASRSGPMVFADPVFGEPAAAGDDLAAAYFAPLAATAEEAHAIKALFPDATVLSRQRATKAALQHVEAPRMLHIASHGFFLPDTRHDLENPLLRSGLALAGANLPQDSHPNGILTALEASGLDLWGTKLVTLSACDTGIGEVRSGEGVYGLRRAFVLAGAETVVMSLWPVSDHVAREMMVAYYTGLRAGLGRGDALRHAKLDMLRRDSRRHPFYWATFIQSGEWAALDGQR